MVLRCGNFLLRKKTVESKPNGICAAILGIDGTKHLVLRKSQMHAAYSTSEEHAAILKAESHHAWLAQLVPNRNNCVHVATKFLSSIFYTCKMLVYAIGVAVLQVIGTIANTQSWYQQKM